MRFVSKCIRVVWPAFLLLMALPASQSVLAQSNPPVYGPTTVLHDFVGYFPGDIGGVPSANLLATNGVLYGTAAAGGPGQAGVVFKIDRDGSSYTILHAFQTNGDPSDGAYPIASLVLSSNTLYGTTFLGGTYGYGTVFAVNTDGSGFTTLYSFAGSPDDGANPDAGLVLGGNVLYGVANAGGEGGSGTVFSLNTDGTDYTNIYNFSPAAPPSYSNPDGANPEGTLILSGNVLYGTAVLGGLYDAGTVFQLNTDGSGFATLYTFTGQTDGAFPSAGVVMDGTVLYGTTQFGGDFFDGNVYSLDTSITNFTSLYSFQGGWDGGNILAGVTVSNGVLYGAASQGGTNNEGTVFDLSTNGANFDAFYSFSAVDTNYLTNVDGANPFAAPILCGTNLYGTTTAGGPIGGGTLYKVNTSGAFTAIFGFVAPTNGADGASPAGDLVLSRTTLYDTTQLGGVNAAGTIFKVDTDGSNFETLYNFSELAGEALTNSDGAYPVAGLLLAGSTLYGAALHGGTNGSGTIFNISTNGEDFNVLYTFSLLDTNSGTGINLDGANPGGSLILSGSTMYGTAESGGTGGSGTIFSLSTNGSNFTALYEFTALDPSALTNSDGASPGEKLLLAGTTIYGTTFSGGADGWGTIFSLDTSNTNFTTLYTFTDGPDGGSPEAGLLLSGNTLYGTTSSGGAGNSGTVFKVNIDGSDFTTLYAFSATDTNAMTNTDGSVPACDLVLSGNILYGTASLGGSGAGGTVFQVNTDGSDFTTLLNLDANTVGAEPFAGLLLSGNYLYGTTTIGGSSVGGTVFAVNLRDVPVNLLIQQSSPGVVLSWSDPFFTLQGATNVTGPYTNIVGAVSPYTNNIAGTQQFFRLQSTP